MHAFDDAVERRVDYATVNDRFFVNNVSLGVYATIVQQEGYRDAKVETTKRLLPEHAGAARRSRSTSNSSTPDGTEVDGAFLIMVSNNPYVLDASRTCHSGAASTPGPGRLRGGGQRPARGRRGGGPPLAGLRRRGGHRLRLHLHRFEVNVALGPAYAAGIDGEALELETPLRFKIHPHGLTLLVPHGNLEAALRRQARDVHVRDLFDLARGRATHFDGAITAPGSWTSASCTPRSSFEGIPPPFGNSAERSRTWASTTSSPTTMCSGPCTPIAHPR